MRADDHFTRLAEAEASLAHARRAGGRRAATAAVFAIFATVTAAVAGSTGAAGWFFAAASAVALVAAAVCLLLAGRDLAGAAGRVGEAARIDGETELPGPAALRVDLAATIDRSTLSGRPFAVAVVTIDGARGLRLERGIGAADRLHHQAAAALAGAAAAHGGRAYRVHGTAIAAILPDTTHVEADRLVRRLDPALALLERRHGTLVRLGAGATVGIRGDTFEDVLLRAERRCERARAGAGDEGPVLRPVSH
jgi:GGDEF domain-containing protein